MKVLSLLLLVALAACRHSTTDEVREFIPGSYSKFGESEYSKAWDTLRISVYDVKGNTYIVQQRVGFQRIQDGKLQPKEYKSDHFMAVYDESTHQLQDMKSGKLLVFSPDKNTVLVGSAEYVKIK